MATVILLHGFGPTKDGQIHPQLHGRIEKAARLYKEKGGAKILYVAADVIATRGRYEHAGEFVRASLILPGGVKYYDIELHALARNTFEEVCEFRERVAALRREDPSWETCEVIAVTTWYHAPRVVSAYRRWWPEVRVTASWRGARLVDILLEPVKFLKMHLRGAMRKEGIYGGV